MFTTPPPLILVSMLGSVAAGSALAAGIRLQKLWPAAARLGGVVTIICCNSATLTLSAFSVNCTWGAAKFLSVSVPVALVWPTEATTFSRIAEFWLKRRSELRIWIGLVKEGILSDAFCNFPLPLKFRAE